MRQPTPTSRGRGFSGRGASGRGFGRGASGREEAIPDELVEIGSYSHACEGEIICKLTNPKIPYFNGTIFLENKSKVGKVEEIFGPIDNSLFTIKLCDGINPDSFKIGQKFHISPDKLIPIQRFQQNNTLKNSTSAPRRRGGGGGGGRNGARFSSARGGRGGRAGRGPGRGRSSGRGRRN